MYKSTPNTKRYSVTIVFINKSIKRYSVDAHNAEHAIEIVNEHLRGYNYYIYAVERLQII